MKKIEINEELGNKLVELCNAYIKINSMAKKTSWGNKRKQIQQQIEVVEQYKHILEEKLK